MTVDYTQFDAETPISGTYISPTWERDEDETDVAEALAHAFVASVLVVKALDWSGLAKKWSDRGFRDSDLAPVKVPFITTFKKAAVSHLVQAAGLGRQQAVLDFEVEFGMGSWQQIAETWANVYGHEMANQVADQSHKAVGQLVLDLINRGMRGDSLGLQAKSLYGLDPRSMTSAMNFLSQKDKPRNRTILDLASELLTRRAKVIGDVQSFTGLNFGRQLTYLEAMDSGLLPRNANKVWVTAIDERVCKVCRPMDGQVVPLMETFTIDTNAGDIRLLVPPVHPNCRCTVVPEERYRHGIITRSARFKDGPKHRASLRSEVEDLVSLGKSASFWEEIKHPRDKDGKFTDEAKHAAELTALTGVAAYTLLHPAVRSRFTIMRMPHNPEAWAKVPSMRHFPAKVQILRGMNPEVNQQIAFLHDLDDETDLGKLTFFHPKAYKHLEGANLGETLQNIETLIKDRSHEHSAVITLQGRILSMGRGSTGGAPVWLPTFLPRGAKGNLVFTHNHPDAGVEDDVLHTLSGQDVIALHQHGIGRARAVTPKGGFYDLGIAPEADLTDLSENIGQIATEGQEDAVISMLAEHYRLTQSGAEEIYGEWVGRQMEGVPNETEMDTKIDGFIAGYQARRMHGFYQDIAAEHPEQFRYNFGQQAYVAKFNPLQLRDLGGRFAAVAGAAGGAYVLATNFPKVDNPNPRLPRHLSRVDRKVRQGRNGTYLVPRQYLDFHQRGQSFRVGNEAHINDMAREFRQSGYKMKPVTLHVYDDTVEVADGNHRIEAAYRAKLGFVPTKIVHMPGKKPTQRGVIPAWRQGRTNEARRVAASRYVGSLEETSHNPFRRLNQRLIAQDEKKHQWHDKSRRRTIKPL